MAQDKPNSSGPDLSRGIPFGDLPDQGTLIGHVGDQEVLLVRTGEEVFAVSPHCTHYHGPLAEGLVVGSTVRCPWHHACFDLRTGEALQAPAIDPIPCWDIEQSDGMISVHGKRQVKKSKRPDKAHREPEKSSSLAAARRGSRQPKCCADKDTREAW